MGSRPPLQSLDTSPPARSLGTDLAAVRANLAAAAQKIYDEWTQDADGTDEVFGGGGICDAIASAFQEQITNAIPDAVAAEAGFDGDDHAYLSVGRGDEVYVVDLPHQVYERGGGMRWQKIEGVSFDADDIVVARMPGMTVADIMEDDYDLSY